MLLRLAQPVGEFVEGFAPSQSIRDRECSDKQRRARGTISLLLQMWGSLFSEVAVLDWNRVDWGRGSRRQKENIWKEINTSTHCSALYSSLYFMTTYWTNKTLPIDEWRNKLRLRQKLWHRSAITAPDAYIHLAKQIVSPWLSRHNISYRYTNWAHGLCTNTTTGSAIGPYQ